ncbi:hypothetical protein Esi_0051_0035 [Ectocarpus siliculosus]|uniref:Uncharacterized protein n=1 Tax=Ectocarpus siliculosus TaxID=2880 RepID=D7G3G3_ECTSI|nr:hypothetical protein Esi_0051_0035 [Ectocarpus siliculosus]|eukprot:CBJ26961.1 hypothetical protein Esi_0051_0035 [Ectocarpus siliculosus]
MEPGGTAGPRRVGTGGTRRERTATNTPRLRKSNRRFRSKGEVERRRDNDGRLADGEGKRDSARPNAEGGAGGGSRGWRAIMRTWCPIVDG